MDIKSVLVDRDLNAIGDILRQTKIEQSKEEIIPDLRKKLMVEEFY